MLKIIALLFTLTAPSQAAVQPYQGCYPDTATGRELCNQSGVFSMAPSSRTPGAFTITLDGATGSVAGSSGTFAYGVKAATASLTGAGAATPSLTTSSGIVVNAGMVSAAGGFLGPLYGQASSAASMAWSGLTGFPAVCTLPNVVTGVGATLTCSQPSNVTGNAATATKASASPFTWGDGGSSWTSQVNISTLAADGSIDASYAWFGSTGNMLASPVYGGGLVLYGNGALSARIEAFSRSPAHANQSSLEINAFNHKFMESQVDVGGFNAFGNLYSNFGLIGTTATFSGNGSFASITTTGTISGKRMISGADTGYCGSGEGSNGDVLACSGGAVSSWDAAGDGRVVMARTATVNRFYDNYATAGYKPFVWEAGGSEEMRLATDGTFTLSGSTFTVGPSGIVSAPSQPIVLVADPGQNLAAGFNKLYFSAPGAHNNEGNMYGGASSSGTFTAPAGGAGHYDIGCHFSATTQHSYAIQLKVNGSVIYQNIYGGITPLDGSSSIWTYYLSAGDTVECFAYSDTAGVATSGGAGLGGFYMKKNIQ